MRSPDADLASLLEPVLEAAIKLQGADFGDIALYDPDQRTLRVVAHRGVGQEFLDHFGCTDASDASACRNPTTPAQRLVIEDVKEYAPYAPHLSVAAATGYRGLSCTPLTERGSGLPLGMLSTFFREPYRPDEARLRWLDVFAAQVGDLVSCRRAQQELRESEEFLRLALEGGRMGTWEWDSETHLIKGDPAHQAWFGMPPQERPMPNEAYWEFMDPEEKEIGTKRAEDALDQGKDIQLELRVYPPNANLRWIAIRGRPHHDGTGSIIGISYDITDRKNRETASRASEERLKSAVELAGLGLYSIEIDGVESLLTWDDRVRKMWGLAADTKVTYQVWQDGVHPDDRERVETAVAKAYDPTGDGVYDIQYRVIGADGVERWVATRGETSFENGRPVSVLGVALDITNRKMIEHGLELVIEMREGELEEVTQTLEAEARAHERVAERLELLQSELSRGLFAAIENRQRVPSPGKYRQLAEAARKIAILSPRERQVLDRLVRGEPHKKIAHRLGISVRTVELHRTRMLHRLGTPHLADAIRLAVLAELAAKPPNSDSSA
jgi:PAS domain S-box-containing protein